jgi:hypothetical protein
MATVTTEDRFHRNESETERKREDDESDKAARRCTGDGGNHRRPLRTCMVRSCHLSGGVFSRNGEVLDPERERNSSNSIKTGPEQPSLSIRSKPPFNSIQTTGPKQAPFNSMKTGPKQALFQVNQNWSQTALSIRSKLVPNRPPFWGGFGPVLIEFSSSHE